MSETSETPTSGGVTPKLDLNHLPKIAVSRSIAKAISWRVLGTLDTLILSFVLIAYVGPLFGLRSETAEALEIAGLIAITEAVTKIVFYFLHERFWTKVSWGTSFKDDECVIGLRRTLAKTVSWRVIASTDTLLLAWLYTGNFATALSIGGLEIFTKLVLYFFHERVWGKIFFGIGAREVVYFDPPQTQQAGSEMADHKIPKLDKTQSMQTAHACWANEGGTQPAPASEPYSTTKIFDEVTLPKGLRESHSLANGVWSIVRVLEGRVKCSFVKPVSNLILDPRNPGRIVPHRPYFLEVIGAVRLEMEFYNENPSLNERT